MSKRETWRACYITKIHLSNSYEVWPKENTFYSFNFKEIPVRKKNKRMLIFN